MVKLKRFSLRVLAVCAAVSLLAAANLHITSASVEAAAQTACDQPFDFGCPKDPKPPPNTGP